MTRLTQLILLRELFSARIGTRTSLVERRARPRRPSRGTVRGRTSSRHGWTRTAPEFSANVTPLKQPGAMPLFAPRRARRVDGASSSTPARAFPGRAARPRQCRPCRGAARCRADSRHGWRRQRQRSRRAPFLHPSPRPPRRWRAGFKRTHFAGRSARVSPRRPSGAPRHVA